MTKRATRSKKVNEEYNEQDYRYTEVNHSPFPRAVKPLVPKGERQEEYLKALENYKIVIATGPSGVGKSFIPIAWAADQLKSGKISQLLITRPAVEVGESLGFLPGEMDQKFAPYLTPVLEILNERLGKSFVELLLKSGRIEATPLAYLRGRTFKDSVVILDEAQNCTPGQMKMFLTRIGINCSMIIDGDIKQKDIPGKSGLEDAIERISYIPSVKIIKFDKSDIVRSGLVEEIITAYEG